MRVQLCLSRAAFARMLDSLCAAQAAGRSCDAMKRLARQTVLAAGAKLSRAPAALVALLAYQAALARQAVEHLHLAPEVVARSSLTGAPQASGAGHLA